MPDLTPAELLSEVEDLIRTMPPRATIWHDTPDNYAWFGRAAALMAEWNPILSVQFDQYAKNVFQPMANRASQAMSGIMVLLQRARHDLRIKSVGPLSVAVPQGNVFDYFDEIRKLIETARSDLLFIDPWLDAEFVSRYLPHVKQGVTVRLLGRDNMNRLVPAVQAFTQQSGLAVWVRVAATGLHDRYIFVDQGTCFQSGASFKDGAKKAPTTLTQVTDVFGPVQATYEAAWANGTVQI